jgi:hypothetical protein
MRPRQWITLNDLWVTDPEGVLMPLVLNPVQRTLMAQLGLDPDDPSPTIAGKRLRKRILKARREGVSTLLLALFFLDTYNVPNRRTLSIAHDLESAKGIFEIVHRFYRNLPKEKWREAKHSNPRELYWADTDSRIFIATAGRDNVASGSTLHNVHKSERAKWQFNTIGDLRRLDASIDEAGMTANIIEETTANFLNHFYQDWQEAERGESPYAPIFIPWFVMPSYRAAVPLGFTRTQEETARALAYSLDDEQLAWYREKRLERKELTPQEYPHNAAEAFIATGNPYFDRAILNAWNDTVQGVEYNPVAGLSLPLDYPELRVAYAQGHLSVWKWPNDDYDYIVSADPAGGINTDGNRDSCSASVVCVQTWEQVAHLHGLWEPRQFAAQLAELGWLYREALVGVLRKNHGISVLDNLLNTYHYPAQRGRGGSGVYFMDNSQLFNNVEPTPVGSLQPGFDENPRTKPYMYDALGEAISVVPGLVINSRKSVQECLTYVHLPGGGSGGEKGTHDDCVADLALAAVLLTLRFERKRKRRERLANRQQERAEPAGSAWGGR